ncbi:RusA family crossover junction endodeoxyribonuclease [Nitrospira sp. BLG_2]|uniref:RusA family crossover junction endodeoxyribonuclease n=1 Tax=Nitrospira sp. BLG_2 TaxID=3397507 RepID=UPI003B9CDA92
MITVQQDEDLTIKISNIPMPPSINQAYKNVGNRRCLARCAIQWYKIFMTEMKLHTYQMVDKKELAIGGVFYFKYPKKSDTSNYTKLLWDGLQKSGVIRNDNRFYWELLSKNKAQDGEEPYVDLTIKPIGEKL